MEEEKLINNRVNHTNKWDCMNGTAVNCWCQTFLFGSRFGQIVCAGNNTVILLTEYYKVALIYDTLADKIIDIKLFFFQVYDVFFLFSLINSDFYIEHNA